MREPPREVDSRRMIRYTIASLALCAALTLAAAGPAQGAASGSATSSASASAKKTRAQKLRVCLKKANRRTGAPKRRARTACRRRYGARIPARPPQTTDPGAGAGPVATDPAQDAPPPPPAPAIEPVRDDAKFREALKSSYLHRQYEVPKPNHGIGFNYHDENYEFCESAMGHFYEGIAYIYKSVGPWQVIEGNINGDSTKANGTIQFTQAQANFAEEVGKVQTIQIEWVGDQVTIAHPEIGTNAFTRQVKTAPCTQ